MGVDRLAFVVVDRPGLQVVLGHPEAFLDAPQVVVGADHELGGDRGAVRAGRQVGGVALEPGQGAGLGLECAVDRVLALGEGDEPVPLDRDEPGDGFLGLGDLLIDPAQGAAAAVGAVLVVDGLVPAAGWLSALRWRARAG